MSKKILKLSLTLACLAVVLSACTFPWQKKAPVVTSDAGNTASTSLDETVSSTKQIKKFDNYDNLKSFLETNINIPGVASRQNIASSTGVSLDSANTSDQLAGADGADIIKSDANYVYSIVRNDIKIVKINPADSAAVVATINFKSRPQNIILSGTSLTAYGQNQQGNDSYTFLKVYDLSNPADPKLVRDLNFEGNFSDIRLIGDYVYLFTDSAVNYARSDAPLPFVFDGGSALPTTCMSGAKCFAPDVYYFDIPYSTYSFASVAAINIKDNSEALSGQSYLLSNNQTLYVSQSNIFITYSEILDEHSLEQGVKKDLLFSKLSTDDQDKINKIGTSLNYVLSAREKELKIGVIYDSYINSLSEEDKATITTEIEDGVRQKVLAEPQDAEKTFIYKMAISGNKFDYRGMGEVNGELLSNSSLDENNDNFRIATTHSEFFSRYADKPNEFYNSLFVLDNSLQIAGSLEGVITKEKITSARFLGNRAYLSSLIPGDPFYVISLSDSSKPSVLGAIKISDFFSYLRAADVDGNKLIAYGREVKTDTSGGKTAGGFRLTLFDFTDLNAPKELDSYLIGTAENDSIVLQDNKTFFYSENKGLLSIPSVFKDKGKLTFAGILVFNIAGNQLVLKGKIDHLEGGSASASDFWNGYDYYDNTVKRSLLINENLFTFSNRFLKINSLNDLKTVKNVILTSTANDYIITPAPTSGAEALNNGAKTLGDGPQTPTETIPAPLGEASATTPTTIPNGEIGTSTVIN